MSPPLALLHGFLGAPEAWDAVVEGLADRPAAGLVVRPYLPGHGPDRGETLRGWDDVVDAVASSLPGEPCLVVGYSMGARLALGLLARHPARVAALVLVSSHLGLAEDAARLARAEEDRAMAELAERQGIDALVSAHVGRPVLASQSALPPAMRQALAARRRSHDAHRVAQVLRAGGLGAMPDLRAVVGPAGVPVTALAGADDPTYVALAREIGARSGGHVREARGVGHDVVLEAPALVVAAILEGGPS